MMNQYAIVITSISAPALSLFYVSYYNILTKDLQIMNAKGWLGSERSQTFPPDFTSVSGV